jgi:anoctamin-1
VVRFLSYLNNNFFNFQVSEFNITAPIASKFKNVTECYYQDYRHPPEHEDRYERTTVFWNITAARLLFVLIFENTVAIVMILVRWLIPDISSELRDQIRREAYITNEIIINEERTRSKTSGQYIKSKTAWNKLLQNNLSGSQIDLFIHKQEETKLKSARNRFKRRNKTQDFISSESRSMDEKNLVLEETKV